MKPKHKLLSPRFTGYRPLLISGLIASFPFAANAADLFWDGADTGPDAQGGTGTWLNGTTSNWDTLAIGGADSVWTNANNDTAIFGGTAGTVTLGSNVTVGGLQLNNGYTIAPGAGPFSLTFGTAGDINVSSGTSTIGAEIAGSSTITKTGNGILQLNAVNSFTGDTVISAGTLRLGTNNNTGTLGPATYNGNISIASGALLDMTNSDSQTFNGVISGGGDLTKRGGGTLTLAGANTYTGKTSIGGGGGGGRTVVVSSFNSVNSDGINPGIPSMTSSSLGAPTTIANGTIDLGSGSSVRSSNLRYTGSGETTDRVMNVSFNSNSQHSLEANTTGGGLLKFTSAFTINPSSGTTGSGLTLNGSGDGEIAAGITGALPGFLNKAGGGTWTIGGSASADSSTVSGGTLVLNGSFNVTTTLSVANGATLSVGDILTQSLTLGATSNTIMGLGGMLATEYDNITLDVAGALAYGGNLNILNEGLYDMDASSSTYDLFTINGASISNSFANVTVNSILLSNSGGLWTGTNGDVSYAFDQALGDLTVTAIPEPSAALLGGLGLLALLRRRRA